MDTPLDELVAVLPSWKDVNQDAAVHQCNCLPGLVKVNNQDVLLLYQGFSVVVSGIQWRQLIVATSYSAYSLIKWI